MNRRQLLAYLGAAAAAVGTKLHATGVRNDNQLEDGFYLIANSNASVILVENGKILYENGFVIEKFSYNGGLLYCKNGLLYWDIGNLKPLTVYKLDDCAGRDIMLQNINKCFYYSVLLGKTNSYGQGQMIDGSDRNVELYTAVKKRVESFGKS